MKVLMLTPYLPYPLLTGGQTRSYNLIKRLSALGHEITLFCLVKNENEKEYVSELEKFCKEVRVFNRPERPWTLNNILRTAFSVYPFLVIRNWARGERGAIEERLKKEDFDLIHAETFYVMPHIPKTQIPILLVEQTIEYLVYKHFVDEFPVFPLKPFLYVDVAKLKFWEKKFWDKSAKVVAMSEEDKKTMKFQLPGLDADIVPNGVDIDYFNTAVANRSKNPIILYLGNFTWLQNREAVKVLVSKIWPVISAEMPNAKLWIIGKDAKNFFNSLKSSDIRVDEVVDVREVYQAARVLVAPIYGGGGTRYKNFEAFASGLPVVTTSIGIGGTNARDGVEVIIRDTPEDIARAAIELIKNPSFAKKIADNARKLVKQKYNWDQIAGKLSQIYEELGKK
ncbi:MAG: Glycosyl transferase group 1 [Microgenomates group bacterium Gr01-1014_7]|nr:MAG: Glycosyl transferase group 1 [Microgenomates group bacterium Gr01-1014_7]